MLLSLLLFLLCLLSLPSVFLTLICKCLFPSFIHSLFSKVSSFLNLSDLVSWSRSKLQKQIIQLGKEKEKTLAQVWPRWASWQFVTTWGVLPCFVHFFIDLQRSASVAFVTFSRERFVFFEGNIGRKGFLWENSSSSSNNESVEKDRQSREEVYEAFAICGSSSSSSRGFQVSQLSQLLQLSAKIVLVRTRLSSNVQNFVGERQSEELAKLWLWFERRIRSLPLGCTWRLLGSLRGRRTAEVCDPDWVTASLSLQSIACEIGGGVWFREPRRFADRLWARYVRALTLAIGSW